MIIALLLLIVLLLCVIVSQMRVKDGQPLVRRGFWYALAGMAGLSVLLIYLHA